jgi:hypothetical protein
MNQRIPSNYDRIDVREYLAKHRATSEFNDESPFSKLPLPNDAISKVADPQNWTCFPELIVRIYLTKTIVNSQFAIRNLRKEIAFIA